MKKNLIFSFILILTHSIAHGKVKKEPSEHTATRLEASIARENLAEIEEYAKNYDINGVCGDQRVTPLIMAAGRGKINSVRKLLELGADLEIQAGKEKITAFGAAVPSNNLGILRFLASKKAKVDVETISGVSPVFYAIHEEKIELLKCLKTLGADMNRFSKKDGMSPLMAAVLYKNPKMITHLLEAGADIDLGNPNKVTALHFAAVQCTDCLRELRKLGANIDAQDSMGATPLLHAIVAENYHAARELVAYGADLHIVDQWNSTAFEHAYNTGQYTLLSFMLLSAYAQPVSIFAAGVLTLFMAKGNSEESAKGSLKTDRPEGPQTPQKKKALKKTIRQKTTPRPLNSHGLEETVRRPYFDASSSSDVQLVPPTPTESKEEEVFDFAKETTRTVRESIQSINKELRLGSDRNNQQIEEQVFAIVCSSFEDTHPELVPKVKGIANSLEKAGFIEQANQLLEWAKKR